jgi:hypothetical protein
MAAYGPSPPKLSFSRWPLIDHLLPRAYVDVSSLAMTLAAVRIDVGPQHGIHAGQMPVALLLEPLENIAIDAQMHRRFAWRHHDACALPEFRIFLWAFGRISAGLVFAQRDLLLNLCQRISYGSRFFGHACWPSMRQLYIMGRTDDIINVAGHRLSTGA